MLSLLLFLKEKAIMKENYLYEKVRRTAMDSQEAQKRMEEGRLYYPMNEGITIKQFACMEAMYEYNATHASEGKKREELLKKKLAEVGEGCYIEAPFYANWGGSHVHFGKNVYANFHLTAVDDGHIYVGDSVMIGPNVTLATAAHPIEPSLRREAVQYNMDIHIGANVWIGAGTVVLPGVTIGENSVIGAGSVVTRDIPANVVAVGNPCRVLREIGERDREYYYRDRKIDLPIGE